MRKWAVFFAAAAFLMGCASQPDGLKRPELPAVSSEEYQIGVGDQLAVQVWKSPELSVNVPVRPDGKISVPLIGDVQAAGETTTQISRVLAQSLNEYVRNAQVTVIVLDPASGEYLRRVRVTGAVESPVSLPHQQGMTVLDLVLESGGLTEFASGNKSRLYRKVGDEVEVYPIYLSDILEKGALDTNYILAPADIVTVPERAF